MLLITFRTQQTEKGLIPSKRDFCEPKSDKMDKKGLFWKGAILIVIVEGYSILMYLFGFMFTVLQIQFSSLLPEKQHYIGPTDFWPVICNVKSD